MLPDSGQLLSLCTEPWTGELGSLQLPVSSLRADTQAPSSMRRHQLPLNVV